MSISVLLCIVIINHLLWLIWKPNFIMYMHVEKQTEYIGFSTTQFQASTRDLSVYSFQ